jgi:hypothetical protein
VQEKRAEGLLSFWKPYLRGWRGVSTTHLPGYVGCVQCLRHLRHQQACEQAELILRAALAPTIARKANKGELVTRFDHFDLLQMAIN